MTIQTSNFSLRVSSRPFSSDISPDMSMRVRGGHRERPRPGWLSAMVERVGRAVEEVVVLVLVVVAVAGYRVQSLLNGQRVD